MQVKGIDRSPLRCDHRVRRLHGALRTTVLLMVSLKTIREQLCELASSAFPVIDQNRNKILEEGSVAVWLYNILVKVSYALSACSTLSSWYSLITSFKSSVVYSFLITAISRSAILTLVLSPMYLLMIP